MADAGVDVIVPKEIEGAPSVIPLSLSPLLGYFVPNFPHGLLLQAVHREF